MWHRARRWGYERAILKPSFTVALAVIILCTVAPLVTGTQSVDPFIATIDLMRRSVAPVVCRQHAADRTETRPTMLGTAFFLSADGEFMTADHVLRELAKTPGSPGCAAIYLPVNGWRSDAPQRNARMYIFDVSRCNVDPTLDLAFCRTQTALTTVAPYGITIEPVRLEAVRQPDGMPVAFTGFPMGTMQPMTARARIVAYEDGSTNVPARLTVDTNAWQGVSGGPVYLSDGRVIGMMLLRGVSAATGLSYARPAAIIQAFLRARQSASQ